MNTDRAERFLAALEHILASLPPALTWGLIAAQLLAILVWFGAAKPEFLRRRPGIPLAVIYAISPFYILVLANALYQTLWPGGLAQIGDIPHFLYGLVSLLLAAIALTFAIWLATEKNPPRRFIPRWLRPPTDSHGIQ